MKKKNAIIIGWHNNKNIGDEATLYCLSKILKLNFNINKIYVLNNKDYNGRKLKYLVNIFTKNKYVNYLQTKAERMGHTLK